jgi:uncharacterized protein YkwD
VKKLLQLAGVLVILVLTTAALAPVAVPRVLQARSGSGKTTSATLDADVVVALNSIRAARGLPVLAASSRLSSSAAVHSADMVANGYFAHDSATGGTFQERAQRYFPASACSFWEVGETLVWATPGLSAAGAVRSWLASPEHRAILLDPTWRVVGVSAVEAGAAPGVFGRLPVTVITADFGVCRH